MKDTENNVKFYKSVKTRKVEWLWYPYIPYGKITIIQGDPGDGKSTFALNLASIISNGAELPLAKHRALQSIVIYQNSEDGKEDTIVPRLKACKADLERVAYIEETWDILSLTDDRIEKVLQETGARLLILDPIQAYLGNGTDMNRATDIRPIMSRISKVAQQYKCAVVLIGHMSKASGSKGLYRSLGSIDIPAAARSVLLVARTKPMGSERILAHVKSNLAPLGESILFNIEKGSNITWLRKSKLTAEQVLSGNIEEVQSKEERAISVLYDLLTEEREVSAEQVKEYFEKLGVSIRTLNRAKAKLGIKSTRKDGSWYWSLGDKYEDDI